MLMGVAASVLVAIAAQASGSDVAPAVPEAVLDGDPETIASLEPGAAQTSATPAAATAPDVPAPDDKPSPELLALQPAPARLFTAIRVGASDEEIENLVVATVNELSIDCPRVREFQIYRSSVRARTLKVKCVERPVFAVTIGASGEAFVSGGDGTIGQMRLADGPIKTVYGVRVEDYVASTRADALREEAVAGAASDGAARTWLIRGAWAIGIAALAALAFFAYREQRRRRRELSRWRGLDSDMKDQLIVESEEIYPDLYRHPEGIFIARGRRGKRRLFPSLVFAYLYRSRGIKLFEIA